MTKVMRARLAAINAVLRLGRRSGKEIFGKVMLQENDMAAVTNAHIAILAPRSWFECVGSENFGDPLEHYPPVDRCFPPESGLKKYTVYFSRVALNEWTGYRRTLPKNNPSIKYKTIPCVAYDESMQVHPVAIRQNYLKILLQAAGGEYITLHGGECCWGRRGYTPFVCNLPEGARAVVCPMRDGSPELADFGGAFYKAWAEEGWKNG